MPLIINTRNLEKRDLELVGELAAADLELAGVDEMIEIREPVQYEIVAERLSHNILVQGRLQCRIECHCVRCLRGFTQDLELGEWTCDLALEGEDKAPMTNDCIDLTPYIREDILLAFPQHPLCEPDCPGLPTQKQHANESASVEEQATGGSGAWAELNKLKF